MSRAHWTSRQIRQMRRWYAQGVGIAEIASRLGSSREMVSRVLNGYVEFNEVEQLRQGADIASRFGRRVGRCRECGRKMVLPCQACRIERERQLRYNVARLLDGGRR